MFNENQFESSEFYHRRYGTFVTKLIWPIVIGLVILVLFMCFTSKQIVVKSIGTVVPAKPLAIIQSSSNNPVVKNNLKEGNQVHKGDLLVQFENSGIKNDESIVNSKQSKNYNKLVALDTFQQSVLLNQNLFYEQDNYGYANQYQDYIAQMNELTNDTNQTNSDIQSSAVKNTKKNNDLFRSNQSLSNRQLSLQSKILADVNNQISTLEDSDTELKGQASTIDEQRANQQVVAQNDGILHLMTKNVTPKYFQSGTEIAEIYPILDKTTKLNITFNIPTNQMNGIKTGQHIRFKANQDGPKPLLLTGKVTNIDTAATTDKNSSTYQVTAHLNIKKQDYTQIKYGLTGNVSVITGKKTWVNYIKDLVFKSA